MPCQSRFRRPANARSRHFQIDRPLRLRRRREEEEDRQRRSTALREATGIVTDANNTADRIVREARAEVERLDHERHRVHAELGVIAGRVAGVVDEHDPARNPLATQ